MDQVKPVADMNDIEALEVVRQQMARIESESCVDERYLGALDILSKALETTIFQHLTEPVRTAVVTSYQLVSENMLLKERLKEAVSKIVRDTLLRGRANYAMR